MLNEGHRLGHALDQSAGGSGGGAQAYWAWNGQDISQFASPWLPTLAAFGFGFSGTPAISVVAGEEANRLRIDVTGNAQTGIVVYPVTLAEALSLGRRFTIQYSLITGTVDTNLYGGVCYLTNGVKASALNTFTGLTQGNVLQGGYGTQTCITNGVSRETGASPNTFSVPGALEIDVVWQKSVGSQPGGLVTAFARGTSNAAGGLGYLLSKNTIFPQPFNAGWNALTEADLDQFGVMLAVTSGSVNNPFVEFDYIQVIPHPLDR